MIKRALYSTLLLTLVVGFTYINSYAQMSNSSTQTATITGTVVDASTGNPVSNIEVQLKGTDNSATTDSTGNFEFNGLDSGKYTLYVDADGYQEYEQDVDLGNGNAQVTVKLQPASNGEDESNK